MYTKSSSGQLFGKQSLHASGYLYLTKESRGKCLGKKVIRIWLLVYQQGSLGADVWEAVITCKWCCISKKELRRKCMGNSHYTQLVACMLKRTFRGRCFGKQSLYASGFLYLKLMFSSWCALCSAILHQCLRPMMLLVHKRSVVLVAGHVVSWGISVLTLVLHFTNSLSCLELCLVVPDSG